MENIEILRCKNLNVKTKHVELKNINFDICQGEFITFFGLNDKTILSLVTLLSTEMKYDSGHIYRTKDYNIQISQIDTRLFRHTRIINNFSIIDNLCLMKPSKDMFRLFLATYNEEYVRSLLEKFNLKYDINASIETISPADKYILEILQLYISNSKIIYLMDFYLFTQKEQEYIFDKILIPLKALNISFVFTNYSISLAIYKSERILIFRSGRLCKTLYQGEFAIRDLNNSFLEDEYDDSALHSYKESAYSQTNQYIDIRQPIKCALDDALIHTIGIFLDDIKLQHMPNLELKLNNKTLLLNAYSFTNDNARYILKNKIFIISGNFEQLLFNGLSVQENITITKLSDMTYFKLIINTHFYKYLVNTRFKYTKHLNPDESSLNKLNHYDKFCIILDRIQLLKPKIIIINSPHSFCDANELILLGKFIENQKSEKTRIIILSSNYQFIKNTSDTILICKKRTTELD